MRTFDETLSHTDEGTPSEGARAPHLYVIMNARQPRGGASRHALQGVEEVHVGRGSEHRVTRTDTNGGLLTLGFPDRWMSRPPHARMRVGMARCTVEDVDSRNGVRVNGEAVTSAVLRDGDVIEVGKTLLLFRERAEVVDASAPDVTADAVRGSLGTTLIASLQRELARIETLAQASPPILVHGPSGSGKEILARGIHSLSRPAGPFVAFNCGALSETLLEAELFGYRRGAFSGATTDRVGLIEAANGGTLFLDEIGDLALSAQAALLRVLQEREVRPVGATESRPVDVRVVAASHRHLPTMVADGTFRDDLYARLAGVVATLPALRDRREDLGIIVADLLARRADAEALPGFELSVVRAMLDYDWPRNIRELEHALEVSLALAKGEIVTLQHVPSELTPTPEPDADEALRAELEALLGAHGGNVTRVADAMGKKRQQIQRWCKRLEIDPASFRR